MSLQIQKYFLLVSLASSTAFAFAHQHLMWGLKNTGQTLGTYINPLQTYHLQAVAGEDIG